MIKMKYKLWLEIAGTILIGFIGLHFIGVPFYPLVLYMNLAMLALIIFLKLDKKWKIKITE